MTPFEILIPLSAILIGGLVVLIPIAGLTARFALKPVMDAIAQAKGNTGSNERVAFLEQRVALLEEQYHSMEREHQRLLEESDFRRQLEQPKP